MVCGRFRLASEKRSEPGRASLFWESLKQSGWTRLPAEMTRGHGRGAAGPATDITDGFLRGPHRLSSTDLTTHSPRHHTTQHGSESLVGGVEREGHKFEVSV